MLTFDLSLRVDRLDAPTLTNITEITSHNQFPGRSGAQTLALGGATSCWAFVAWLELEAKRTNFLENINAALDFDYGSTHLENWQANASNQRRQITSNSAPEAFDRPLHLNC